MASRRAPWARPPGDDQRPAASDFTRPTTVNVEDQALPLRAEAIQSLGEELRASAVMLLSSARSKGIEQPLERRAQELLGSFLRDEVINPLGVVFSAVDREPAIIQALKAGYEGDIAVFSSPAFKDGIEQGFLLVMDAFRRLGKIARTGHRAEGEEEKRSGAAASLGLAPFISSVTLSADTLLKRPDDIRKVFASLVDRSLERVDVTTSLEEHLRNFLAARFISIRSGVAGEAAVSVLSTRSLQKRWDASSRTAVDPTTQRPARFKAAYAVLQAILQDKNTHASVFNAAQREAEEYKNRMGSALV